METIVLVHGIFGVGSELFPGLPFAVKPVVDYFNGVKAHLNKSNIEVKAPTVPPLQSIEARGEKLALALADLPKEGRIDIIAHSMGGLDARYLLQHHPAIAKRITSLTTIGTPHHGSAVADMVHQAAGPVIDAVPQFLRKHVAALADLTTEMAEAFNETTRETHGVHCMNIAGVASSSDQQFLLNLAARIGEISGPNDGVVLRTSAQCDGHEYLGEWPVDHFGEIGWTNWHGGFSLDASGFYPDNHLQRYNDLLKKLWSIPPR